MLNAKKVWDKLSNSEKIVLSIILIFSLLRIAAVWLPTSYIWDEAAYIGMAQGLQRELPFGWIQSFHEVFFRAPLLVYGIYAFTLIFQNAEFAAKFFISVVSVLNIIAIYYAGKIVANKKVGLISAAILATNPFNLLFSFKILVENLFGFLVTMSLIFFFRSEQNKKYLLAFVFSLALAIYSRYSGILLVPAVFVALLVFRRDWLKEIFKNKYFYLATFLFVILLIPIINGARGQLNERSALPSGHYLIYWIPLMGTVFPISLYGIWKGIKDKKILFFLVILFLLLIGHELIATRLRYIVFLVPLFSVITAYGFVKIGKLRFANVLFLILLIANGVIGLILVMNSTSPPLINIPVSLKDPLGFGELNSEKYESYRIAGLELKEASSPDDIVLSDSCVFVNIYSERACYWFANKDYLDPVKDLTSFINRTNVKWIYVVDKDAIKILSNFTLTKIYEDEFVRVYELMKRT